MLLLLSCLSDATTYVAVHILMRPPPPSTFQHRSSTVPAPFQHRSSTPEQSPSSAPPRHHLHASAAVGTRGGMWCSCRLPRRPSPRQPPPSYSSHRPRTRAGAGVWRASSKRSRWTFIQQASSSRRSRRWTEPHHGLVKPHHGLVKPHHGLVKPHHGLVKPHHGLVKPRDPPVALERGTHATLPSSVALTPRYPRACVAASPTAPLTRPSPHSPSPRPPIPPPRPDLQTCVATAPRRPRQRLG